jgi:hypothetical protein
MFEHSRIHFRLEFFEAALHLIRRAVSDKSRVVSIRPSCILVFASPSLIGTRSEHTIGGIVLDVYPTNGNNFGLGKT